MPLEYPEIPSLPISDVNGRPEDILYYHTDSTAGLGSFSSAPYHDGRVVWQCFVFQAGVWHVGYYATYYGYIPTGGTEIVWSNLISTYAEVPSYYRTNPNIRRGYEEQTATPGEKWSSHPFGYSIGHGSNGIGFYTVPSAPEYDYTDYYGQPHYKMYMECLWDDEIFTHGLYSTARILRAAPSLLPLLVPFLLLPVLPLPLLLPLAPFFALGPVGGAYGAGSSTSTSAGRRRKPEGS